MTNAPPPLRTLFVGGPGRSGTTVVAQRLCELPQTVAFEGVELKFFTEKNGLLDLWHSLGEQYSPNRAVVAMRQFRQFTRQLIDGKFSQLGLSNLATASEWHSLFDKFTSELSCNGHPEPVAASKFDAAARNLISGLHEMAMAQPDASTDPHFFIDNTPHTILGAAFVTRILPDAAFLHVMRDPRSIAQSLRSMSWGPDNLEQCCTWVDSYCRAWANCQAEHFAASVDVRAIHIEDLAADPNGAGQMINEWLGLPNAGRYFAFTDPLALNGWAARANEEDLTLLNNRLADWIDLFGYAADQIGIRPKGPSGAQPCDRAEAPLSAA